MPCSIFQVRWKEDPEIPRSEIPRVEVSSDKVPDLMLCTNKCI